MTLKISIINASVGLKNTSAKSVTILARPSFMPDVYKRQDIIIVVLDNSTTAMTGHQPHPGTGKTMMGNVVDKVDIKKILEAVGVKRVETANPLDLENAVKTVQSLMDGSGVRAVIFKAPCIAVAKPDPCYTITDSCVSCKRCITELGCPAIVLKNGAPYIEPSLCYGCGCLLYTS